MAKAPVPRTPFTDDEATAAFALGRCSYLPGTWAKRFGNDISSLARTGAGLTDKQRGWLWKMVQSYRRQLPTHIVATIPTEFIS